ncbi:MAG: M12 family metallopeptidase, partial [Bacteroidota bacterium]
MKSLKTCFILAAIISLSCSSKFKPETYQAAGISVHFEDKVEYIMPYPSWVPDQLGLLNAKKWPKDKREFRIQFVNGDQDIYTKTLQDWDKGITRKTGLKFTQVATQPDMIVSFVQNNQAWSYVGKDLAQIAKQGQPTMNLGWHIKYRNNEGGERYGTGNHEMLHALGYIHTLQSPAAVGNLKWNRDFVYAKYAKLGWNKTMVDANVLSTYSNTIVTDNQWDPKSIMCYPVGPGEANIQVGRNNEFSSIDDMKLVSDYAGAVPPTTGNTFTDSLISCFKPARQSS